MGKVLTWIGIGLAIWVVWKLVLVSRRRAESAREARSAPPAGGGEAGARGADRLDAPERMVECAVCGLHLPGSEARFGGGKVYCSDAHREQGARGAPLDASRRDERP
jgi:uncharacterized protein